MTRPIPTDVLIARQPEPPMPFERIGAYLRHHGATHDGLQLWPEIAEAEVRMAAALDGVGDSEAAKRLDGAGWSVGELAFHVVEGKKGNLAIVRSLLQGDAVSAFVSPDPEWQPVSRTVGELRIEYLELCTEFAALARDLPLETTTTTVHPHPFFGDLHPRAWFAFQRIHDTDHAEQIEAIRAAGTER